MLGSRVMVGRVRRVLVFLVSAAVACAVRQTATQSAVTVIDVAASGHMLLLLSDGTVVGLVENRSGELGRDPAPDAKSGPVRIALPRKAVQVAAGIGTSYALLDDGTVWAWGKGNSGELGVTLPAGRMFRATSGMVPGLHDVKKITATESTAMALQADGSVKAWGLVSRVFTKTDSNLSPQPVEVTGVKDAIDIAGATGLGIATTRDRRAIAWDLLSHPYLLPGGKEIAPAPPAEVAGLRDVVSIAVQGITTAAVTADGAVWTWGQNAQAGLGNGTRAAGPGDPPQFEPLRVPGVTGAVRVRAGQSGRHYIVLRKDATLIGWGNTDWGQLGAGGTARFQPTPTPIRLANVDEFWLGGNYSFARTKDGAFWFWGHANGTEALLGTRVMQAVPAKVEIDAVMAKAQ